ncbi:MAG: chondroitinase-B domain-containing protein, partial [Kouleothrix sp.]
MRSFLLYTSLLLLVAVNILSSHAAPATQTSDTSVFLPVIQAGGRSVIVTQNIQAALDQAQPGDTIIVPAGTYVENLVFRRAGRAGAPITLRGAGASATIIQGAIRIQAQQ